MRQARVLALLLGARSGSAVPGNGGAELGWVQSYAAGYNDSNGRLAGGSEVMHIKAHGGRLYAFNGYWEDEHWPAQSAQVLRLDSPNGTWQVDLDTGEGLPPHMKGNIMHEVHFSTDKDGKPISKTLLIAASQSNGSPAGGNAVSVYVRDDRAGAWSHTYLLPGNSPKWGGGRKVPRDMIVYRDPVTTADRIFLLCGQPGVISGAYDAATGAIDWDDTVEYPPGGATLATRPLGLAQANGRLYFDVGGQVFVRSTNGRTPNWTLAYQIPGDVNIELGGIRGLSTVPDPSGAGDSLLFVWTPKGNAPGDIIRVDGAGLSANSTETSLRALYDAWTDGIDGYGTSRGSLGGYNKIFPVPLPSGETVHIVGMEQTLNGANSSVQYNTTRYYCGAVYGVRRGPTQYSQGEVNGRYVPGKPCLEAPRAFARSPFPGEENVVYFGGFDTNFIPSTNHAWIFKAGTNTVVGPEPPWHQA